jgi:cell division ATPase FtsA
MSDKEVLENIANMLRIHYPTAASVKVFVNCQEFEVEVSYRDKLDGISMKSLNGEWIKEESA